MPSVSFGPSALASIILPSLRVMLIVRAPGPPKPSAVAVPVTLPSEAVSLLAGAGAAGADAAGAGAAALVWPPPKSAGLRPAATRAFSAAWAIPVELIVAPLTQSTLMLFFSTIAAGIDAMAFEPMPSVSLGP